MFLKNILTFSAVNAYGVIIRTGQEVIVRMFLKPDVFGYWSFILLLFGFAKTFDLGVLAASNRTLPLLYGAKRFQRADEYRRTAFYLQFAANCVIAVGIIGYSLLFSKNTLSHQWMLACAAATLVIASSFGESFISFYQSAQAYQKLSIRLFIYWTIYGFFLVTGAYFLGVLGIFLGTFLAAFFQAFLLKSSLKIFSESFTNTPNLKKINIKAAKSLLGFALPFRAIDYPLNLLSVLDGLFVSHFLGLKQLAIYTTAKVVLNQTGQLPAWINSVFIVRLTTLKGSSNQSNQELGVELYQNLLLQYLIIIPISITAVIGSARFFVPIFLSEYMDSLDILIPLLLTLYFLPSATVYRNLWIIDRYFKGLAFTNLLGAFIMIVGLGILSGKDAITLKSVAFVFFLSFFGYYFSVLMTLGRTLWKPKQLWGLLGSLALSIGSVLLSIQIATLTGRSATDPVTIALMIGAVLPVCGLGAWQIRNFRRFLRAG